MTDLESQIKRVLPQEKFNNNPILVKHEVGLSKKSTYNLPPVAHTYGYARKPDPEGAKEVTMSWTYHQYSKALEPQRDFKKLNKMSLQNKAVKPNEISEFRKSNDARVKVKQGQQGIELILPSEDFTYGIKNKPSTPMNLIMSYEYGHQHERRIIDQYTQKASQKKKSIIQVVIATPPKKVKVEDEPIVIHKQKRFNNVPSKVKNENNWQSVDQLPRLKQEVADELAGQKQTIQMEAGNTQEQ